MGAALYQFIGTLSTAATLAVGGALLIGWGAGMAHKNIAVILTLAIAVLACAGSLAFVAFMAEVRHQGWVAVVKQMRPRERQS